MNTNKNWFHNEYINNKKSIDTIAKEIDISSDTIRKALIKYNIPRRRVGRPNKHTRKNFYSKIKILPNGCWEWQAKIHNPTGYGHLFINRKTFLAHRISYILHKGTIPNGLVVNHLCRNRKCVNPNHLEVITLKENILKGFSIPAINSRKTHCIRGHPLIGDNLYITPKGRRQCKECQHIRVYKFQNK